MRVATMRIFRSTTFLSPVAGLAKRAAPEGFFLLPPSATPVRLDKGVRSTSFPQQVRRSLAVVLTGHVKRCAALFILDGGVGPECQEEHNFAATCNAVSPDSFLASM